MANQINFIGKKPAPFSNQMTEVSYLANLQTDGYAYFNDEFQYRCRPDGSNLQLFYYDKQIWVQTTNIQDLKPSIFDLFNLIFGNGTTAANGNVEVAVQWLINKAKSNYITYSQSNRNLNNPNGLSYDCSSFVITGFNQAGFNINASYTGNMKAGFTAKGFKWIAGRTFESSQLIRGDILLNENLHTQVYIGNNQDVNCGSTPARVLPHSVDNYGSYWDGILRYTGA